MRKIILLLIISFQLIGCEQQNDFKHESKLPNHLEEAMERLRMAKAEVEQNSPANQRNILSLETDENGFFFIRGKKIEVNKLQEIVIQFVINPTQDSTFAESPKQAIIHLNKDINTSNEIFLTIYNRIKAAYNIIWDKTAIERYGEKYKVLSEKNQKEIRADFPMNFVE